MHILKTIFKKNAVNKGVVGDHELHMYRTSYMLETRLTTVP